MNRSLVILLAFLALIGWLVWSASRTGSVTCEACITFGSRTECAKAAGPDREHAMMEATTVVCSKLSSGMTEGMRCQRTPPLKQECTGEIVAGKGRY